MNFLSFEKVNKYLGSPARCTRTLPKKKKKRVSFHNSSRLKLGQLNNSMQYGWVGKIRVFGMKHHRRQERGSVKNARTTRVTPKEHINAAHA
jgi:hypothetical protein